MNVPTRLERVEQAVSELVAGREASDPWDAARKVLADPVAVDLLARLRELVIIHGPDHPDAPALAARLDDRLRIVLGDG
jgi:hypothetical protein